MTIVAFAASSSSQSINRQLVSYAVSLLPGKQSEVLNLNDFEIPLFSEDRERELGQPALAQAFLNKLNNADAIIIGFAEHNGSYSAAYKNLFDWCSRIQQKVYAGKDMVLLSTSPGPGGGRNVMSAALDSLPHFGANILGSLSVPSFYESFNTDSPSLTDPDLQTRLEDLLEKLT